MKKTGKWSVTYLCVIGLMAALCFVSNYLQIPIPTPLGNTRVHFGNVFCLLSGYLLGGLGGGLAAGLGNFLYDLVDPRFISSAPFTFVFKFMMAFVCAVIAYSGGRKARKVGMNIVGGAAGAMTYVVLYLSKTFVKNRWILGTELGTVWTDIAAKAPVSILNGLIAVVIAVPLGLALHKALSLAHLDEKLFGNG